jgi:hypothetical protein
LIEKVKLDSYVSAADAADQLANEAKSAASEDCRLKPRLPRLDFVIAQTTNLLLIGS